ncbi:MAG TPA: D-glucuronyl C5-epimerase family protein [Solirubrobacteraceae bacterium]|nr:D-glucuronyl C5-epimerase family protein [Solirubrobacteraceae bacterium]
MTRSFLNREATTTRLRRLCLAAGATLLLGGAAATVAPAHLAARAQPGALPFTPLELVLDGRRARPLGTLAAAGSASSSITLGQPRAGAAAKAELTVPQAVAQLGSRRELPASLASSYRSTWIAARSSYKRLRGTRRSELGAVLDNLSAIARAGLLTPSRLPALMLTLDNNRRWWTTGPLLSPDQRVGFPGSGLVWEYYPGQGIEIQWLGTFGAANGLYDQHNWTAATNLLNQAIALAVLRGGGIAWEYDFSFDGGAPPWVSAITEGTAVQALGTTGAALKNSTFIAAAHRGLGIFTLAPPTGVRSATPAGARYLIYSFAPHEFVINAFIQSLVGLFDLAASTGDSEAATLFRAGNAQALLDLPRYNTGGWSLYDQSSDSSLSYHELLTGFLSDLCKRTRETTPIALAIMGVAAPSGASGTAGTSGSTGATGATGTAGTGGTPYGSTGATGATGPTGPVIPPGADAIYCTTAAAFTADLKTPPALHISALAHSHATLPAHVVMTISKPASVTFSVSYAGRVVSHTTLSLAAGRHSLLWRPPHAGAWLITLAATDLAGNQASATATATILAAPPRHHHKKSS